MRKKALITDGVNCIGISFAMKIASLGMDIILIGSDSNKLRQIKEDINKEYNVDVELLLADLTNYNDINRVSNKIKEFKDIEILVNCAGYTSGVLKKSNDGKKELEDVHANITSYSSITRVVLPKMLEKNSGTIIFVSSQLAFSPFLKNSVYGASKDFMNIFAEIIYREVKGSNITIQSLNPGAGRRFLDNNYQYKKSGTFLQPILKLNPNGIVEYSFENLGKSLIVIPGWKNKLLMHFKKLVSNVII